jgi:hypothetical protein
MVCRYQLAWIGSSSSCLCGDHEEDFITTGDYKYLTTKELVGESCCVMSRKPDFTIGSNSFSFLRLYHVPS